MFWTALLQEYTLAHTDRPDTLAGAEQALKKHEDFVNTMEANEDKIDGALQSGHRLVDSNNLYAVKVQDKMDSIQERSVSIGLDCCAGAAVFFFHDCKSDTLSLNTKSMKLTIQVQKMYLLRFKMN